MSSDKTNNLDGIRNLDEKHNKEWNEHLKKHDDIDKKWQDEHKQLLEKHKIEKEGLNPKKEEKPEGKKKESENKDNSLEYDKMSDKELSQAFQDLRMHKIVSSTETWQDNIKKVKDELEKRKNIKKSIQGIRYF